MRSVGFIISILVLIYTSVSGAPISRELAEAVAETQLKGFVIIQQEECLYPTKSYQDTILSHSIHEVRPLLSDSGEVLAYVAVLEPKGFIVISSDTDIRPVIAYSMASSFPFEEQVENALLHLVVWDMENRLDAVSILSQEYKEKNRRLWDEYLAEDESLMDQIYRDQQWGPHITTEWHQQDPYNRYCPIDPVTGYRSSVGCVATAMAQVINYWEYPAFASFDPSDRYETYERGIRIDEDHILYDFPSFDELNQMLFEIDYASIDDISALNLAAGISIEMDYASDGSGAYMNAIPEALIGRFGYANASLQFSSYRGFYDLLEMDMKLGCPAILGISSYSSGHSIVADGFYQTGEFHLNFGWGGDCNAWYFLPAGMPEGYHIVDSGILMIYPYYLNNRLYVDGDIAESGMGASWSTALKTIHEAVLIGIPNPEIWVKEGTYLLDEPLNIDCDISIYGGFAGWETQGTERDWKNNRTVIDGQDTLRCLDNNGGELVINGIIFVGGSSNLGGAIRNEPGSAVHIENCTFSGNTADSGGAIYNGSNAAITNCVFSGNTADSGGAIYNNSTMTVTNCTFSGNSAFSQGGALCNGNAATVVNTVLWGDMPNEISNNATLTATYSDIQGGYAGEGNIDENPGFVDLQGGNLHLLENSPCIDAGINSAPEIPEEDLDGNQRVIDADDDTIAVVDMGAYEYQVSSQFIIRASAGANGIITPSGNVVVGRGAEQTFIITPGTRYNVREVVVDGVSIGSVKEYTFSNVRNSHTVEAYFVFDHALIYGALRDDDTCFITTAAH